MKLSVNKSSFAFALLGILFTVGIETSFAAVNIANADGWKVDSTGAVNAFLMSNTPKTGNTKSIVRVRTGFNASQLGINVTAPDWNGSKVTSRVALYPSIQSSNTKSGEPALQLRESFISIAGDSGEFVFGRTLSTFQRQQIIFDMSGFGVGATSPRNAGNSTSAGLIGYGYLYTNFNAGIVYITPAKGGFTLRVGLYDPSVIGTASHASVLEMPRFEFEAVHDMDMGGSSLKIYASGSRQAAKYATTFGAKAVDDEVIASGISGGVIYTHGDIKAGASTYTSKGMDEYGALDSANAIIANGNTSEGSGYHVQVVKGFGQWDVGLANGQSKLKEIDQKNTGSQLLAVYNATDYLKFNAEYGVFETDTAGVKSNEYSSVNVGTTLRW